MKRKYLVEIEEQSDRQRTLSEVELERVLSANLLADQRFVKDRASSFRVRILEEGPLY